MQPLDGFILAAGLGTRMGPLSQCLPKPAWTLDGLPLIQWAARSLREAGLQRLGCNAHHLAERLREAAGPGLEVFEEPALLGSAGGLRHALGRAADPLAVWNADALAEVPWERFLVEHRRRRAQLSWLLVPHPGGPWNPVWLDALGRVLPAGQTGEGPYHFTGASLWGSEALALLPEGPSDTKANILPRLREHHGIVVAPFPWREVGTPDQLIEAAALLAPDREGRIPGCYVHPEARPGGRLERCILGPGACLREDLEDRDAFWFGAGGQQRRLDL